ncbi:MAG TPA: CCA tRNA nucleotidyltransferase [Xanthobacteraceae bacterium]
MTADLPRDLRDAPWLKHGPLPRLLEVLDAGGEEARVVGGAVRNALLGESATEIDIATTAVPQVVVRRAEQAGFKTAPTGVEHGTVTVIVDGTPFEVTTLREDVETYGRKARVRFGRDWDADARRRDFTINALSATRDGSVHDPVGGLPDVAARRVRFIGDARQRIREDFLRILRFFRFHAAYASGAPDAEGLAAAVAMRDGLVLLSRERVRAELMKLLVARGAAPTLETMADTGLLTQLLAGVAVVPQLARLVAIETALGLAPDPLRRLGALAVHVAEDGERLWVRLRLSNAEHERLVTMPQRWREVAADLGERAARALLYRLGPERFTDRVLFAWTRSEAEPKDAAWRRFLEAPQRWNAPRFPLGGADLIARGLEPGPALGRALARAETEWIAADFPADAKALAAIADRAARDPAE